MVVAAHIGPPSEPIMSAHGGRSAEIEVKFLAIEIYLVRHSKEHSKFCTRLVTLCAVMILREREFVLLLLHVVHLEDSGRGRRGSGGGQFWKQWPFARSLQAERDGTAVCVATAACRVVDNGHRHRGVLCVLGCDSPHK